MTDTDIQIKINAVATDASREIKRLTKQIDAMNKTIAKGGKVNQYAVGQMTRSFKSLTAHVSKLMIIYGTFKTLLTSTVITAKFEQSVKKLGIYSGATAIQLQELEDKAKALGESTVFSASQVAEGMNEMALAGLSSEQMLAGIGDTLNLASVGMITLKEATDYTVTSMKTYGLEATDMNNITDIFAKGATISATTVTQLGHALTKAGAVANSYNISLEETTAMLGLLADGGRRGAEAGTQLKIAMLRLASNPEAKKYLDQLNISMYKMIEQADGTRKKVLLPFTEQLRIVRDRLRELDAEARNEAMARIFGTEAVASAEILMNNLEKVHENLAKIRDAMANDFATQSAIAMVDTLTGTFKNLLSALEGLAIKIIADMTPALREMLDGWTETIRGMDEDEVNMFAESLINLVNAVVLTTDTITKFSGTTIGFISENRNLLKVVASLGVAFKILKSEMLATFVVGMGSAGMSVTRFTGLLIVARLKVMALGTAMMSWTILATGGIVAVVAGLAIYIDRLQDTWKKRKKLLDLENKGSRDYASIVDRIVEATNYQTGVIGKNNVERAKLAKAISEEISKLLQEEKTLKKGSLTTEEYIQKKETLKEVISSLQQKLVQLGSSWEKETGAIKKATDAQIENLEISQKALDNFDKYDKTLQKRVNATDKAIKKIEKIERGLLLKQKQIEVERLAIIKKYADMRSQIIEEYDSLEYEGKTKNLSSYEKYLSDRNRALDLANKAEEALTEGRLAEASRYYSEAKSLASSFSASVIEENGKILASSDETYRIALSIYKKTKEGELKILNQKKIAELEANANKMELIVLELEGQQALLKMQKEQLEALKNLGKTAEETKKDFDEQDYFEKINKDFDETVAKFKSKHLEAVAKLDKEKFDQASQQLEEKIDKINNKGIDLKVKVKDIDEATKKTHHLESRLVNGNYEMVVVANDEDLDESHKKVSRLETKLVNGNYEMVVVTEDVELDDTTKKVSKLETKLVNGNYEMVVVTNIKDAKKEIDKIESHAKSKKPVTQELVSDVLPAKLAIDQFVGWVGTQEASMKVYVNITPATQGVNKLIAWINNQVAYVDVYERYHSARAGGGLIPRFANGGMFTGSGRVAGYDPTDSDKVSARLTGGEFVVKREAVDSYGLSILHAINTMSYPKPRGYAMGGVVGGAGNLTSPSDMSPINLNIGNQSFRMMGDRENTESLVRFIESEGGL